MITGWIGDRLLFNRQVLFETHHCIFQLDCLYKVAISVALTRFVDAKWAAHLLGTLETCSLPSLLD